MRYEFKWTEVTDHRITLDAERAAQMLGITVDQLADLPPAELNGYSFPGTNDRLAEVSDDAFCGLEREGLSINPVNPS